MAKKPALQKPARTSAAGSLKPLLWVCMIALVMIAVPETIILLFIGLLPTLVAFIIDKASKKYAAFCVGSMNLAGVFPSVLELWAGQNNIAHAIQIITNVFDLAVMYFAAAFGWMLYVAIPPVVNALLTIVAQHKIAQLRGRQRELIKEWGEGIAAQSQGAAVQSQGAAPPPPPGSMSPDEPESGDSDLPPATQVEELDTITPPGS